MMHVASDSLKVLLLRPDRDDYVIVNWSNIRGGGASQYLRDAWASDSEASLPAKCETTGSSGENMQSCYSGWRVGFSNIKLALSVGSYWLVCHLFTPSDAHSPI